MHERMGRFYLTQAASVYIAKFGVEPICFDLWHNIVAKSSCASTSTLPSTYLRLLLVIDRVGSSLPTSYVAIIANNYLHRQHHSIIAAITAYGQRQC
jgi:hypothetical protein